jgi:hypothetical protein
MKKGWTTTKLIATGSLGVLRFILTLTSIPISISTGIPGSGGAVSFIFAAIILVLTVFIIQDFWAATISCLVFGVLAIPFPFLGPPGFLPKIILVGLVGVIVDVLFLFLKKREKIVALTIGGVSQGILPPILMGFLVLLDIPGSEKIFEAISIPLMVGGGLIGGSISGYFGYVLYKKVESTTVVKRIQQ